MALSSVVAPFDSAVLELVCQYLYIASSIKTLFSRYNIAAAVVASDQYASYTSADIVLTSGNDWSMFPCYLHFFGQVWFLC